MAKQGDGWLSKVMGGSVGGWVAKLAPACYGSTLSSN